MKHILKCTSCSKYTLEKSCHGETVLPIPAKFSIEDKYGEYRRKVKKEELKKKGLY